MPTSERPRERSARGAAAAAGGASAAAILAAFLAALANAAAAVLSAVRAALQSRYPDLSEPEYAALEANEQAFLDAYREAARARVEAGVRAALSLPTRDEELAQLERELAAERARSPAPDPARLRALERNLNRVREGPGTRAAAVRGVLQREEQYARQQSRMAMARAVAGAERVKLKQESPWGAYWELSPHVREHTVGCLIMGGKAWPWAVLDRVHPPRHGGCPCRLRSIGYATQMGLIRGLPSIDDAIHGASGVLMEADVEGLLIIAELARRGDPAARRLIEFDPDQPRDRKGRWTDGPDLLRAAGALSGLWKRYEETRGTAAGQEAAAKLKRALVEDLGLKPTVVPDPERDPYGIIIADAHALFQRKDERKVITGEWQQARYSPDAVNVARAAAEFIGVDPPEPFTGEQNRTVADAAWERKADVYRQLVRDWYRETQEHLKDRSSVKLYRGVAVKGDAATGSIVTSWATSREAAQRFARKRAAALGGKKAGYSARVIEEDVPRERILGYPGQAGASGESALGDVQEYVILDRAPKKVRESELDELSESVRGWDESLHPRDRLGRFIEKIRSLTPRGEPGPTHARLPDDTRVTADPDGTYRVVRNGRIVRGFRTPEAAARDAVDRSARATNDGQAIGGRTRYPSFAAAKASGALGAHDPDPRRGGPLFHETRAEYEQRVSDWMLRHAPSSSAAPGDGLGGTPVAVGPEAIRQYRLRVSSHVVTAINDVGFGPVTDVRIINNGWLAFEARGRTYTVDLDLIAVGPNGELSGMDQRAVRAWTDRGSAHTAPSLTNQIRRNAGQPMFPKEGTHSLRANQGPDPFVERGVSLEGGARAPENYPTPRLDSPSRPEPAAPAAPVLRQGDPGFVRQRAETLRPTLDRQIDDMAPSVKPLGQAIRDQLHGFENGGLTALVEGMSTYGYSGGIYTDDGTRVGAFSRSFDLGTNGVDEVYHSSFTIDSGFQGRGIGAPLTERMFEAYRRAGVKRVRVSAGLSTGGYMWAKMGFGFATENARETYPRRWARDRLPSVRRVALDHGVSEDLIDEFQRALEDGHLDEPWKVARFGSRKTWVENGKTMWLGKKLLLGAGWEGVKKLN